MHNDTVVLASGEFVEQAGGLIIRGASADRLTLKVTTTTPSGPTMMPEWGSPSAV